VDTPCHPLPLDAFHVSITHINNKRTRQPFSDPFKGMDREEKGEGRGRAVRMEEEGVRGKGKGGREKE